MSKLEVPLWNLKQTRILYPECYITYMKKKASFLARHKKSLLSLVLVLALAVIGFFTLQDNKRELTDKYSVDRKHVYYRDGRSGIDNIVVSADPATFVKIEKQVEMDEHCGFSYWKDKNSVYLQGKKIEDADPNTFEIIPYKGRYCNAGQYSLDAQHVFYNNAVVEDVDRSTFVYNGSYTITDRRGVYYVKGKKCFATETLVKSELGYTIKIPKNWDFIPADEYNGDEIFDCGMGSRMSVERGPLAEFEKKEAIKTPEGLVSGATIQGWYVSMDGHGYSAYEMRSSKDNIILNLSITDPIEYYPFLSTVKFD